MVMALIPARAPASRNWIFAGSGPAAPRWDTTYIAARANGAGRAAQDLWRREVTSSVVPLEPRDRVARRERGAQRDRAARRDRERPERRRRLPYLSKSVRGRIARGR